MDEQTQQEILEYIRDNLNIEVSVDSKHEGDSQYVQVRVTLLLDGVEITSAYDSTSIDTSS